MESLKSYLILIFSTFMSLFDELSKQSIPGKVRKDIKLRGDKYQEMTKSFNSQRFRELLNNSFGIYSYETQNLSVSTKDIIECNIFFI